VSGEIKKKCITREPTFKRYLPLFQRMESYFRRFLVKYIERNKNGKADELAKATPCNTTMSGDVFFQVLEDASIKTVLLKHRVINIIE
jgi:hypothetical protein